MHLFPSLYVNNHSFRLRVNTLHKQRNKNVSKKVLDISTFIA